MSGVYNNLQKLKQGNEQVLKSYTRRMKNFFSELSEIIPKGIYMTNIFIITICI